MALTLSVGFVVDDAIVVLENIVRHHGDGRAAWRRRSNGSREIGFTILSMTFRWPPSSSRCCSWAAFMGRLFTGVRGHYRHAAILVSGFVSLSLTPMLASRFLRPPGEKRHGIFYRAMEAVFTGMLRVYELTLRGALRAHPLTFAISLALIFGTWHLFLRVPKGFIPSQDTGQIFGATEAAQDISFDSMVAHQQEVARVIMRSPYVESFSSSVMRANQGMVFVRLKPREVRRATPEEVIESLRPQLAAIPGIRVYLQNPPLIRVGGQMTRSLYQYTLQGADMKELYRWAPIMEARMRALPGLQDVNTDLQINSPQILVQIDRGQGVCAGGHGRADRECAV
jgi:HAE1 family hydrophobic/amphiphilic exporter-1